MRGSELREIRTTNKLSQTQFGKLVGAHRVTVSDWEREIADVAPAAKLIARILEAHPELLPEMERWMGLRK